MLPSQRFGLDLFQWFDMWSVENPDERADLQEPGMEQSVESILEVLRVEQQLLPSDKIFLGGIGQGFATALVAFIRNGQGLAGLVGLCSWLPCQGRLSINDASAVHLQSTPIFLGHSGDDDVVPMQNGMKLYMFLTEKLCFPVKFHIYTGGGHWLNEPRGVDDIFYFLTLNMERT